LRRRSTRGQRRCPYQNQQKQEYHRRQPLQTSCNSWGNWGNWNTWYTGCSHKH
jgi:hypothetical protein